VYNAVDTARFLPTVTVPEDAPLVFLGRIESIKGPHLAIQIAREAGRRLVIAGNVPAEAQDYFDREIAPHIDGRAVSYAGAVDDAAKGLLLSSARALLMPILWDEPFGIVMAEALACGTPVLGLSRGSVPEVVEDGVTGFSRGTTAELVETVAPAARLDRRACRRAAETRFSQAPMVDAYLAVYEEAIASTAGRRVPIAVDHAPSVGSGGAP
jgi:glycosyltransferase involved in cell wall biosynthesis